MRPSNVIVAAFSISLCASLLGEPAQAQDADKGQHAFARCAACHTIDGTTRTGPTLANIVGRKSGSIAGFRYSRAMKNANLVWDEQTLDAYIAAPQKEVPGNVMPFAGISDPGTRADIIAYLATLK